jgi:gliding motility-associated-like protein
MCFCFQIINYFWNQTKPNNYNKMIKITLFFLMMFSSFVSFSQLTEGFEGTSLPDVATGDWVLPSGTWKVFDNGIGLFESWKVSSAPFACTATRSAFISGENVVAGTTALDWLVTPQTMIPNNGQLRFITKQTLGPNFGSLYSIRVSTTSQTTGFTTIQTWTEPELNAVFNVCEEKVVQFPAVYVGVSVYVAFVMENINGDSWIVDDVTIVEQCLDPTTQTATNSTLTTADLGWDNPSGASQWEVEIVATGATPTGTGAIATTNPYTATGLTQGTCYDFYVRALCTSGTTSEWIGPLNFCTTTLGEACGAPIPIPSIPYVTTDNTSGYGDDVNGSPGAPGCGTTFPYLNGDDVFYSFTATTANSTTITSQTNSNWSGLFVYTSCANVGVSCVAGSTAGNGNTPDSITFIPTIGQTYYIVISTWATNAATQSVPYTLTIIENTCTNMATTFAVVSNCASGTDTFFVTANVTNMGSAVSIAGTTNPVSSTEVITAPGVMQFGPFPNNTPVTVNLQNEQDANCFVNSAVLNQTFCPAPNDLCANAIPVTCGSMETDTTQGATTTGAPATACGTGPGSGGVWYTYAGNGDVVTFSLCGSTYDTKIQVYTGTCGAFTCVTGNDDFAGCGLSSQVQVTTAPGTLYYVYVFGSGNAQGTFTLNTTCITPPPPPANDGCDAATVVPVNTDESCTLITPGTVVGATPSAQANACLGTADDDVWFSFTATQTTHTITLQNIAGSTLDLNHAVYSSSSTTNPCGALTQVLCSNPNLSIASSFISGQVYFIRVYTATATPLQTTTFDLCVSVPPPPPANDSCATPTVAPVNQGNLCTQTVAGTISSATASPEPNACGGTDDDDVWFQFTATNVSHIISLNNITGTTNNLNFVVYSGATCGALTQVACNLANNGTIANLTVGTTYLIRVYTDTATTGQFANFDLCIGSPSLSLDNTTYTVPQLITDVLVNSPCAQVSNITWKTGNTNNYGSTNGIAYFQENAPGSLPFSNGIVMTTGNAMRSSGPNDATLGDGNNAWTGDAQLEAIITAATGQVMNSRNATVIEFDFVPIIDQISFDFMFASEEYGFFQCLFSDSFAFLLTDVATATTTNLALVPMTVNTPISVVTVRDALYNGGCASVNAQYFDVFNGGANGPFAATNYNGQTKQFTASSTVTPFAQYHIKMVIADRGDNAFDSAVFLSANSFNLGNVDLGNDFLEANGSALCTGDSYTIISGLDPANYTFEWSNASGVIAGETGPNLTVTQEGTYSISAQYTGTTCAATDSIIIEFYDPFVIGTPNDLIACNSTGYTTFDLTSNNALVLDLLDPADYTVTYYNSQSDADNQANAITNPLSYTNIIQNLETIFVRIENNIDGCFQTNSFDLIVQDLAPQFTLTNDFSICDGQTGTIVVTPINYVDADVTYSWTLDASPLPDTTGTISVNQAGTYTVVVNNNGCTATMSCTISITPPSVVPTFDPIVNICQDQSVPSLPTSSTNATPITGSWDPLTIDSSVAGTVTYTFTPDAGQCAVSSSMDITIDAPSITVSFTQIPDICQDLTAPTLPTTSNEGVTGTWSPSTIDTSVIGTVTYGFTPDGGQCAVGNTMNITIDAPSIVPAFDPIVNICQDQSVPSLPTSSANATPIVGTWSPATIDSSVVETVTYTFTPDGGQCAITTTLDVTIIATPPVQEIADVERCENDAYILLDLTIANNSYYTETGGPSGSGTMLPFGYAVTSTQTIYVYASNGTPPNNCTNESSFTVTVIDSPVVALDGGCENNVYTINASISSGSFVTYSWTGPSGAIDQTGSSITVNVDGEYTCLATTTLSNGSSCSSDATVFAANGTLCVVQKGISPNGDGSNDYLDLTGLNVKKLEIFNRYGKKVYSYSNYTNQWYGQSDNGNELPTGTYYFVMERDNVEAKSGWIYINR